MLVRHDPSAADRAGPSPFTITVSSAGDVLVLELAGEVDASQIPCLQSALSGCCDLDVSVVRVDLRHVTFLGFAALQSLCRAHTELAARGARLEISGCSRPAGRVLQLAAGAELVPPELLDPAAAASDGAARSGSRAGGGRLRLVEPSGPPT